MSRRRKDSKTQRARRINLTLALIIVAASTALAGSTSMPAQTAWPNFDGVWLFDRSLSDPAIFPKGQEPENLRQMDSGVTPPTKKKNVDPKYPSRAYEAGLAGSVVLEGFLSTDGKLRDLWFRESIPQFDKAAFDAVSRWEYTPTILDGKAVEVMMTATVNFNIPGSPPNLPPPVLFTITRENDQLKVSRPTSEGSETISYRLDGQSSKNMLETGGASDRTYLYTSAWNGQKLVSQIAFKTKFGARTNTETIWLDAGKLVIETTRNGADGAPMVTQRQVFQQRR